MNKTILLLFVVLLALPIVTALDSDLWVYYNLNEGAGDMAIDSSPTKINASLFLATYNQGLNGTGVEFTEKISQINITKDHRLNQNINNTGLMLLAWIYMFDNSTTQVFFEKKSSFKLQWLNTKLDMSIPGKSDSSNNFFVGITENEWHQVVFLYNQTHMILIFEG